VKIATTVRGTPGDGQAGCNPPLQTTKTERGKTDFVDMVISKVFCNLAVSRNQPRKSADGKYLRILKNKLIKLKKAIGLESVIQS
jgi:hypothetical protein